jgi:pyruvate, orthophosphate dikinase
MLTQAPQNPVEQLMNVINALHRAWFSEKATALRESMNMPCCLGTAIIIQSMVLGNISQHSGTGVCFSR